MQQKEIKRWQEYTEELYKRRFNGLDNYDGVVTHLEPDNLDCEVNWASGSITMNIASGGDGIPVELFKTLKVNAAKHCIQYVLKIGKLSSGHTAGKGQFSKERQCKRIFKLLEMVLILLANKIMLKIFQDRLQQYVNWELPGVQTGFRKGKGTRDQIANIRWIIEKTREFQKHLLLFHCLC